ADIEVQQWNNTGSARAGTRQPPVNASGTGHNRPAGKHGQTITTSLLAITAQSPERRRGPGVRFDLVRACLAAERLAGKRASGQAGLPEKAQSRWPGAFSRLFFNDSSSSMAPSGGSGSSSRSAVAPAGACADGAG